MSARERSLCTASRIVDVIRTYHTAEGALDVARFIIRADMAAFDYRFPVPD